MCATLEFDQPYERAFARSCGFADCEELAEASSAVLGADGDLWYLTALPDGHWLVWPYPELDMSHQFRSFQDAIDFLKPQFEVLDASAICWQALLVQGAPKTETNRRYCAS